MWIWEGYQTLSAMRSAGAMSVNPIAYADALRWCDEHDILEPHERQMFVDGVQILDAALFAWLADQRRRQRAAQPTASRRAIGGAVPDDD